MWNRIGFGNQIPFTTFSKVNHKTHVCGFLTSRQCFRECDHERRSSTGVSRRLATPLVRSSLLTLGGGAFSSPFGWCCAFHFGKEKEAKDRASPNNLTQWFGKNTKLLGERSNNHKKAENRQPTGKQKTDNVHERRYQTTHGGGRKTTNPTESTKSGQPKGRREHLT